MNLKLQANVLLLAMLIASPAAYSQQKLDPVLGTVSNCEEAKALLDLLRNETGNEGVTILVARLGNRETSRKINRERLYNIWSYLHHAGQFPENRLVKAEGERARGQGRVELYAKGKLMLVLMAKVNGDIVGVKSCGMF